MADARARLGVAVSGGSDSVALLLLAHEALPGRIEVASVDHGLRSESAAETRFVADLCRDLGVPHAVLTCEVGSGNLQDRARRARYAVLGAWAAELGLAVVATAHHADDQAETVLMRLARGSGLSGLAGVRAASGLPGRFAPGLSVVRPLLGWYRLELAAVVAQAGIAPVRDPSNHDTRFDRARVRKVLDGVPGLDTKSIARSAAHLAEAERTLDLFVDLEWDARVEHGESEIRYRPHGPALIRKLVVRRIVAALGGHARMGQVDALVTGLERGETGTLAGVIARVRGGFWVFADEPARRTGLANWLAISR